MKKVILFFLIAATSLMVTVSAYSSTRTDSVEIEEIPQAKSLWCWAACAEIAGRVFYPTSTRTQHTIVMHLKSTPDETYPNVTGTIADSVTGSEYVTYNTVDFDYTFGLDSIWTFEEMATSLRNGYPIQALIAPYSSDNERLVGHVVVIHRTDLLYDTSNSESHYFIRYYDPWDGGSYEYCLYADFCDGTYNDRIYDGQIFALEGG